jgi:hypothetical protein
MEGAQRGFAAIAVKERPATDDPEAIDSNGELRKSGKGRRS